MIFLPGSSEPYRIFAIDPGTDTLGVAVLDFDLRHQTLTLQYVQTFKGSSMARSYPHVSEVYGDRAAKIQSHQDNLLGLMDVYRPTCVIAEAPFIGKFKQAGMALVELLAGIRGAVQLFDPTMPLEIIEPKAAKAAVNAAFNGSQKVDVQRGVMALPFLQNPYGIDIAQLDEHSTDAIAVGVWKARSVYDAVTQ